MAAKRHVFEYLETPSKYSPAAVNVVYGDEAFLKRLTVKSLRSAVAIDEDTPFATFDGDAVEWRESLCQQVGGAHVRQRLGFRY